MRELPARLSRRGNDRGMTLVELLVAMVVLSIALAMVYGAVILVMRMINESQQSSEAVSEARLALMTIDRQVRSGNVLFSPENEPGPDNTCTAVTGDNSGTCMRVYTQANGNQKCVQWQVTDDGTGAGTSVLRMRSWETTWETTGGVTDWGIAARGLVVGTPAAPFKLQGALTPYDERLLQVDIGVRDARSGQTIPLTSSLSGRNTSYGYGDGICTPVPPE